MSLRKIVLACSMVVISCVAFTGCPKPGQDATKDEKKKVNKQLVTSGKSAAAKQDAPKPAAAEKKDAPKADAKPAETKK